MTGGLSKNLHGVGIGPLSKIWAVNYSKLSIIIPGRSRLLEFEKNIKGGSMNL